MSSRKLLTGLFIGLIVSFLWSTRLSNPLKSSLRASQKSHNHYALTLKVFTSDTEPTLAEVKVQILAHPEIKLVADLETPGTFYLSRKGGWKEQKSQNVNLIVASNGMFPKLVTAQVGLDCDEEHHEEKIETITLVPRTLPIKVKYSYDELKLKWKEEGGASLLVDALERNSLDSELARLLSNSKKSDKIENVIVLFNKDEEPMLVGTKNKAHLAFPGFSSLLPSKSEEIKGVPASIMSGTAEEILLLANMPNVHFIAKID